MTWWARARFVAWVAVVVVGAWGIWSVRAMAIDLQAARQVDRARSCVTSWEGRQGIRTLIDIAARQGADPDEVAAFRDLIDEELPLPDCNLEAAEAVVARADR